MPTAAASRSSRLVYRAQYCTIICDPGGTPGGTWTIIIWPFGAWAWIDDPGGAFIGTMTGKTLGCAIGTATQTPALFCGRVCLDALDGRLNKSSVCLEGERSEGGFRVPLDLTAVEGSYALFPGQVVGVVGSAPGEDGTILARSIILGSPAPPA